jgi:hypothetical protein
MNGIIPLKRVGTPEEIASVVLCTELVADGGICSSYPIRSDSSNGQFN